MPLPPLFRRHATALCRAFLIFAALTLMLTIITLLIYAALAAATLLRHRCRDCCRHATGDILILHGVIAARRHTDTIATHRMLILSATSMMTLFQHIMPPYALFAAKRYAMMPAVICRCQMPPYAASSRELLHARYA